MRMHVARMGTVQSTARWCPRGFIYCLEASAGLPAHETRLMQYLCKGVMDSVIE